MTLVVLLPRLYRGKSNVSADYVGERLGKRRTDTEIDTTPRGALQVQLLAMHVANSSEDLDFRS